MGNKACIDIWNKGDITMETNVYENIVSFLAFYFRTESALILWFAELDPNRQVSLC